MPFINLIQEQLIAKQLEEKRQRVGIWLLVAAFLFAFLTYGFMSLLTEGTRQSISQLEADTLQVQPLVRQIDEVNKEIGDLNPRLQTLEQAQANTGRWRRILNHFVTQTPGQTWLTGLRSVQSDVTKPVEVSVLGNSENQTPIGEFLLRSQTQPDLGDVKLKYTQERVGQNGVTIEFEMGATVKGTDEPAPKEEPKP